MSRLPSSRTTARSLSVLLPLALALAPLSPAAAARGDRLPQTLPLVTGQSPEGISAGPGRTVFTGARSDGALYVSDTRDGSRRQLVAGRTGEVAVGLLYDARTNRIWVAGGGTGDITAYDATSGARLYEVDTRGVGRIAAGGRFLNDVAITEDAVYVTDSRTSTLLVVDLGPDSALPPAGTARQLEVTGDFRQPATGNGLNGLRALPTGELLGVAPSGLFRIDPATGASTSVQENGTQLTGGDGLVLDGSTLYVVFGLGRNSVAELRFDKGFTSTTFVRELLDRDLNRPTTGAVVKGELFVVNGQFSDPATAPTEVVRVDTSRKARPDTISYPAGIQPEGITAGPGSTFFAGAINGGALYRGDVRTGQLTELVPADGGAAIGLSYDARTGRLWVAGGPTRTVTAYDARTGAQLLRATVPGTGFLNDVAVTRDAVYVTDSSRPQLAVIPLGKGSALPAAGAARVLPVTGYTQSGGFGLNGLVALPDGDLLAVASDTGALLRIDPLTGRATELAQSGTPLVSGDGLVLSGRDLYVVAGGSASGNEIVQLRLDGAATRTTRVGTLLDPDFDRPSTAAFVAGDLYAVNAQFGTFGRDPGATAEVVRVDGT